MFRIEVKSLCVNLGVKSLYITLYSSCHTFDYQFHQHPWFVMWQGLTLLCFDFNRQYVNNFSCCDSLL